MSNYRKTVEDSEGNARTIDVRDSGDGFEYLDEASGEWIEAPKEKVAVIRAGIESEVYQLVVDTPEVTSPSASESISPELSKMANPFYSVGHQAAAQARYETLLAKAKADVEALAAKHNIPLDRISYAMNPTPYRMEVPGGPPIVQRIDKRPGKTILDYGSWRHDTLLPQELITEDPESVAALHKFLFRHRDFPIKRDLETEGTQLAGIGSHELEWGSGVRAGSTTGRGLLRLAEEVPFFSSKQTPPVAELPSATARQAMEPKE